MKLSIQVNVLVVVLLAASKLAAAARPPDKGPPTDPGSEEPPDLGDMVKLYRDEDGVPILTPPDPDCDAESSGCCHQPLASDSIEGDAADLEFDCVTEIDGTRVITNIDQYLCAVNPNCSPCLLEVDFGRSNVIRTSPDVFDSQMDEVVRNLQLSQCVPTLDAAGRPCTTTI